MRAFSVGHSTHSLERFVGLLARHGVERLVDVRRTPRSRRHPQFERDSLVAELPARGVDYRHLAALGGRRRPRPDSPNGGWGHEAVHRHADPALTDEFAAALAQLCALARERPTAFTCAEAPWWRCHRRLVADRLTAPGWSVCHIGADGTVARHALPESAMVAADGTVRYPPAHGAL